MRLPRRAFLKVSTLALAAVTLTRVRIVLPQQVHMPHKLWDIQPTSPICQHPTIE